MQILNFFKDKTKIRFKMEFYFVINAKHESGLK